MATTLYAHYVTGTEACTRVEGQLLDHESTCGWSGCGTPNLENKSREKRAVYLASHVRAVGNLDNRTLKFSTNKDLKQHLLEIHPLPLPETWPPRVDCCFECRIYRQNEAEWTEH